MKKEFKIVGKINNITYTLFWEDGRLQGDKIALEKAQEENKKEHGNHAPLPMVITENYLSHPDSAWGLIMNHVFDSVDEAIDYADNDEYTGVIN